MDSNKSICYPGRDLPLLFQGDVVVAGGSFGGIAAAVALAQAGRRVALVEPRTYLGREITATLRPWLPRLGPGQRYPQLIEACLGGAQESHAEVLLHMDAVKLALEDALLAAGVKLIYASLPVGLVISGGALQAVTIANKSGRQALSCGVAVDATETALLARLAGAAFTEVASELARFTATLEFDEVLPTTKWLRPVPERLGVLGNQLVVHPGYRGPEHWYVEVAMALPARVADAREHTLRDVAARRLLHAVAEHLIANDTPFGNAWLAGSSYELDGPHAQPMAGATPSWAGDLDITSFPFPVPGAPLGAFAGPVAGLWCLNEAARLDEEARAALRDPTAAAEAGSALGSAVASHWIHASAPLAPAAEERPTAAAGASRLQVREQDLPQRGRTYSRLAAGAQDIPVLDEADVLVVGGGTSGAVAAIVAGREGAHTSLVEMNPGLGGAGTYGGIPVYWFGRSFGYVSEVLGWLGEAHERLHLTRPAGVLARWNPEAKTWVLLEKAQEAGASVILNALVTGTILEGQTLRGVTVATRYGPAALLSKTTIDATGDADVAAFAGAPFVYGSEREHAVMYSYLPQVPRPGRPRNVKTSMVDVSNIEDYTRMILAERRRGKQGDHDHGIYVAPRESRHIVGEVVLTETDQLTRRSWPDVVYIAFANHDIKGESTSDWVRMGLQPPHVEIEIPYRAILPTGVENLLVAGKAFSATHDALAAPRMQSDMENLGGVAALAAVEATRQGVSASQVDVRALQRRLVDAGVLPRQVLDRQLRPLALDDGQLRALVAALDADKPLHAWADLEIGEPYEGRIPLVDIMVSGPRAVPILEEALAEASGRRRILLAEMLCMLGSSAGVPPLAEALGAALAGDELPRRAHKVSFVGLAPDQWVAPEPAHWLYALGAARDERILPLYERVVELLGEATREDVFEHYRALYYYVAALCYGAERLGNPAARPILRKLHSYLIFRDHASAVETPGDWLDERLAHLELLIGRSLARCGDPEGYIVLINYLTEPRALLAEHAHAELAAITSQDLGKDMAAWGEWLEQQGDALSPAPWAAPTEPVAAWREQILTATPPADPRS